MLVNVFLIWIFLQVSFRWRASRWIQNSLSVNHIECLWYIEKVKPASELLPNCFFFRCSSKVSPLNKVLMRRKRRRGSGLSSSEDFLIILTSQDEYIQWEREKCNAVQKKVKSFKVFSIRKKILELGDLTWHESVVSVTFTILVRNMFCDILLSNIFWDIQAKNIMRHFDAAVSILTLFFP